MQHSPHTQSQQNTHFAQTDLDPERTGQTLGSGEDAALYDNRDGAQMGAERSPRHTPGSAQPHRVEPATAAYEGSVTSRVSSDAHKQGISSHSSAVARPGQEKVVKAREDARAGLNHSGKNSRK